MTRFHRYAFALTALVAIAIGVLAAAAVLRIVDDRLHADLASRLDAASPEQAAQLIAQLDATDDVELQLLVQHLDDERFAVQDAADSRLREQLAHWRAERTRARDLVVVRLASLLSQQPPPLHARAWLARRRLAQFLLDWPPSALGFEKLERTCRATLAGLEKVQPATATRAVAAAPMTNQPQWSTAEPAYAGEEVDGAPILSLNDDSEEEADSPSLLPHAAAEPLPAMESAAEEPVDESSPAEARATTLMIAPPLHSQALTATSTRQLFRHLHGLPAVVNAARAELHRRGFDEVALSLAAALDDPDPLVRRQLVERLPLQDHVDAAAWLEELASDEDPTVREAAQNILATGVRVAARDAPARNKGQR
jgi:hypothetical protein